MVAVTAEPGPNAERHFALLVDAVHAVAIAMLDPDGRVATWNAGAEHITGYSAGEIVGRHASTCHTDAASCERELATARQTGRFAGEGWRVRRDGTRFWAGVELSAIRAAGDSERPGDGALIGFAMVTRDLSEQQRAKDELVAMLGHELRNPLAPIVTAVELMRMRGDRAAPRELHVIDRQVRHVMRLVDDLIDVARIAHGKVELHAERIDLREPVAHAVAAAGPLARRKCHDLHLELADEPLRVDADAGRIAQIVSILVGNAAKYTEDGGHIRVAAFARGNAAVIEVTDDGAGIDPELLPRVFDPFVQGPQHADRASGGLGVGLALVRTLVDLHGGRVEAASAGRSTGSRFTVSLPLRERVTAHRRRILLVEDNEDARALLAEILATLGYDVVALGDPGEALERAQAFAPEVAILDIGLPGMDGYELAVQLRARLPDIALVAVTGYGEACDRERGVRAGFSHHFVKPVEVRRLVEVLG